MLILITLSDIVAIFDVLSRAVSSGGKSYDECGFCISAGDAVSLQRCAPYLSRQAQTAVKDEHQEVSAPPLTVLLLPVLCMG